jgi:glycosyltransferase involved in cell wall biosynthesis
MKVAIDVSQVAYGTGVSVYTRELVSALIKSKEIDTLLFAGSLRMRSEIDNAFDSKVLHLPIPPKAANIIWNQIHTLPIDYFLPDFDLLHTSDWTEPKSNKPKITTIHDISPLTYPQYTPESIVDLTKKRISLIKKESRAVIVPSTHVMKECIKFGFEEETLHVIPEAVSESFMAKVKKIKKTTPADYILAIGTHPRKNLPTTISAFKTLKGKLGIKRLVVVGTGNSEDGVEFTGKVSEDKLVDLYASALCLCYPSIDEGFGLPILEAMSLGVPVVTSDYGATKETASGAAVLVNPNKINSLARGVLEAVGNYEKYSSAGLKIAPKYSWENAARRTIELYRASI